jgi:hypothetical protein
MKNLVKLEQDQLLARAKVLYFDVNPNIEKIFVDEYGHFSYRQNDLLELNRLNNVGVFEVTRKGVSKIDGTNVLVFSKKEDVAKAFGKKKAEKEKKEPTS